MQPLTFDFIVVGSGPSGMAAAEVLQLSGFRVCVLEEGKQSVFQSYLEKLRSHGTLHAKGRSRIPLLQGKQMGGSAALSGGVMHALPQSVYAKWSEESHIDSVFRLEELRSKEKEFTSKWKVGSSTESKGALEFLSSAASQEGLSLQSMNRPQEASIQRILELQQREFVGNGGVIKPRSRVFRILFSNKRAKGVELSCGMRILAERGVVLAAGPIQTPQLIKRSLSKYSKTIGSGFSCHLSTGVVAEFSESVKQLLGNQAGLECLESLGEGVKFASQELLPSQLFARTCLFGSDLSDAMAKSENFLPWTVSVATGARGYLRNSLVGGSQVAFEISDGELNKLKAGLKRLSRFLLGAGAKRVYLPVHGVSEPIVESVPQCEEISCLPTDPRNYWLGAAHLFGSCLMSSCKDAPVSQFRLRETENIFVVDASTYPSPTVLNPQLPIAAIASLATEKIIRHI